MLTATTPPQSSLFEGMSGWISALGVLFGIIVLVSAALAVIFSTAAKQRTQLLEDTNKALTERVAFLEKEADRKDSEHKAERVEDRAEFDKRYALDLAEKKALTEKVSVLERVVTGREQLEHIQAILEAHDARVDVLAGVINNNHSMMAEHVHVHKTDMTSIKKQLTGNRRLLTSIMRELVKADGDPGAEPSGT
jgi:hypothetical protein